MWCDGGSLMCCAVLQVRRESLRQGAALDEMRRHPEPRRWRGEEAVVGRRRALVGVERRKEQLPFHSLSLNIIHSSPSLPFHFLQLQTRRIPNETKPKCPKSVRIQRESRGWCWILDFLQGSGFESRQAP